MSNEPNRIGYARVSTQDQLLTLQTDALTDAGCHRIFMDTGSGSVFHRPGWIDALDYLRPGDTLMVWRLDRLGRSLRHLVDIVALLNERQIGFVSLKESIDTTCSTGKLVFHLFASLAEFERELIQERTRAGLIAARARGRIGGRPKVLDKEKLHMAKTMVEEGILTRSQISRALGIGRTTLYRYLLP